MSMPEFEWYLDIISTLSSVINYPHNLLLYVICQNLSSYVVIFLHLSYLIFHQSLSVIICCYLWSVFICINLLPCFITCHLSSVIRHQIKVTNNTLSLICQQPSVNCHLIQVNRGQYNLSDGNRDWLSFTQVKRCWQRLIKVHNAW